MIKKITIASVVAMAIVGCGGSGSSSDSKTNSNFVTKNSKAVTVEGLKSMNSSIGVKKVSAKNLRDTKDNYETKSDDVDMQSSKENDICSGGGSFSFLDDEKSQIFKLSAQNCKEGTSTINGSIVMKGLMEEGDSGTIEVTKDLTINDSKENIDLFASKGSNIFFSDTKIKADFNLKVNGETISADNLVITGKDDEATDSSTVHFASGALNVGEYYFKIVKQKSDFITDENGIKSGVLDLVDGAGHKVELSANNNKISLKVDQNGDGVFDTNEVLSEDITKEDFSF
jgi:hypothetical protein